MAKDEASGDEQHGIDDDDEGAGGIREGFATLAGKVAMATGSVWAFSAALIIVGIWAATGPIFHYSETWQLVINTGTTIITFLMVFVIQHAQNKDMRALHLKLNEIIAATEGASNRLIDVEDLSERELDHLWTRFCRLATEARLLGSPGAKLTVENEAQVTSDGRPIGTPKPIDPKAKEKLSALSQVLNEAKSSRAARKRAKKARKAAKAKQG
jgi:low affinity Fe/Cu permease